MELPPYRPPGALNSNTSPLGQTPRTQPNLPNGPAPALDSNLSTAGNTSKSSTIHNSAINNNEQFLKKNIGQQFDASVLKSQAVRSTTAPYAIHYQVLLTINNPQVKQTLETTTNIPLVEGQQLKIEIINADRIRIISFEKSDLTHILNQHLKSALVQQEPLSHSLKALQQLQQKLQAFGKTSGAQAPANTSSAQANQKTLQALQQSIQKLLSQLPTIKDLSTVDNIKRTIRNSGVSLEANLRSQSETSARQQAPKTHQSPTLKSTLSQLKQNLQQLTAPSSTHQSAKSPASVSATLDADLKAQLHRIQQNIKALQTTLSSSNQEKAQTPPRLETQPSTRAINPDSPPKKPDQQSSALEQNQKSNAAPTEAKRTAIATPLPLNPLNTAKAVGASNPLLTPSSHTEQTTRSTSANNPGKKPNPFASTAQNTQTSFGNSPEHSHFFVNNASRQTNNTLAAVAQSAVANTLDEVIETLLRQSNNGLARIQLNQLQSLINLGQATLNDPASTQTLQTELPVIWKDGHIDIVQLTLEDKAGQNSDQKDQERQWQINLRFDFEELGLIHIQLTLSQTNASTTVWVEQAASMPAFQHHLDQLSQSLQNLGLSVNEIQCLQGLPVLNQTRLETHLVDINT
ncbi:MAG: hypothetical protein COB04_01910 [Gammaproteobacteria bacterium]|nr:MAG: hypothetical protein COB04_01910 [Gammaproteobacteria bacterium]